MSCESSFSRRLTFVFMAEETEEEEEDEEEDIWLLDRKRAFLSFSVWCNFCLSSVTVSCCCLFLSAHYFMQWMNKQISIMSIKDMNRWYICIFSVMCSKKKNIAVYVKYVLMSTVCSCKAVKITLHLFALYWAPYSRSPTSDAALRWKSTQTQKRLD